MILHVFNSSVVSGPETLVIPALKSLAVELNESVHLLFLSETRLGERPQAPLDYARAQGFICHEVKVRSRWDRKAFKEILSLLSSIRPRIVHAHDVKASLYIDRAVVGQAIRSEIALVSTHHGAVARKGLIRLYEELYVRWVLPRFDRTLVVCSSDVPLLTRRNLDSSKIRVHLNGVDRNEVTSVDRPNMRAKIRSKWIEHLGDSGSLFKKAVESDTIMIGVVARLSSEKRHDRMLNCLARIVSNGTTNVSLVLFGSGALEQELKARSERLNLASHVFWMGYRPSIGQEMAGFDLVLCLSDGEGIPINLLEAGWAGTPVFSTRVGGISDIILDQPSEQKTGWLVELDQNDQEIAKQLEQVLILKPEDRNTIGQRFQEGIKNSFSQKAWIGQLISIYGEL